MSFIKKDKINGIIDYDIKHIFIEDDNEGLYRILKKYNPIKKNNGIIISKKYKKEVKELYNQYIYIDEKEEDDDEEDEDDEEEEDEEEEESSDDELIQEVLKRRLKSESKQLVIEEDTIENSDDEDVISLSRRLRFVFNKLKELKKQS